MFDFYFLHSEKLSRFSTYFITDLEQIYLFDFSQPEYYERVKNQYTGEPYSANIST